MADGPFTLYLELVDDNEQNRTLESAPARGAAEYRLRVRVEQFKLDASSLNVVKRALHLMVLDAVERRTGSGYPLPPPEIERAKEWLEQ